MKSQNAPFLKIFKISLKNSASEKLYIRFFTTITTRNIGKHKIRSMSKLEAFCRIRVIFEIFKGSDEELCHVTINKSMCLAMALSSAGLGLKIIKRKSIERNFFDR